MENKEMAGEGEEREREGNRVKLAAIASSGVYRTCMLRIIQTCIPNV